MNTACRGYISTLQKKTKKKIQKCNKVAWLCLTIHDTLDIGKEHQYKSCPTWQLKLIKPTQLPLMMFYTSGLQLYYAYFFVPLKRCICIWWYHCEKIVPPIIKKPMVCGPPDLSSALNSCNAVNILGNMIYLSLYLKNQHGGCWLPGA